jgi:hypothetical protein
LELERYATTRPYLYHLTHRDNLKHIREMARLLPAATLMELAGRTDLMRIPRRAHVELAVAKRVIGLRDQKPLHEGKMRLPNGYTFPQFIESLNRRLFFWPGDENRPINSGMRHFECYKKEKPIILRIDFEQMLRINPSARPLFCRYNSGSPRVTSGIKSPRGPDIFLAAHDFQESPCKVVEATFESEMILPPNTQFALHPSGPWKILF